MTPEKIISTHTPAWGVTAKSFIDSVLHSDFNSHARVGRDVLPDLTEPSQINFNSHARVGRDCLPACRYRAAHISTHTPAWGVTPLNQRQNTGIFISTHTPAWGVTLFACACLCEIKISTHTPAWGVT